MGLLNVLKANWEGKVGQTVGAKWKNKSTIRTYTKPSNPKTAAQQSVRSVFASMTSFIALFADSIKYLSALDTSGMSVRNAIIKLNKDQIEAGTFDKTSLEISKGGLQSINGFTATASAGKVNASWTAPTAVNFTNNAKLILVAVQADSGIVEVAEAAASAGTLAGTLTFEAGSVDVYAYFLDKRGSNKVASISTYAAVTIS